MPFLLDTQYRSHPVIAEDGRELFRVCCISACCGWLVQMLRHVTASSVVACCCEVNLA